MTATGRDIPGTHLFDGQAAMKGYALNAMCFSFNEKANREAFLRDEAAYLDKFDLTLAQRDAVAQRNVADYGLESRLRLIESNLFAAVPGKRYDLILDMVGTHPAADYRRVQYCVVGREGLEFRLGPLKQGRELAGKDDADARLPRLEGVREAITSL